MAEPIVLIDSLLYDITVNALHMSQCSSEAPGANKVDPLCGWPNLVVQWIFSQAVFHEL